MSIRRTLLAGLCSVVLFAACGTDGGDSTRVTVFAAASLTDAFTEIGAAFETAEPSVDVAFNFAGSSSLREQLLAGAPADVFASADPANLNAIVAAGLATGPVTFATNALTIAVPLGNPAGIVGITDFGDEDLLIGLCAEAVPCGALARDALTQAGVVAAIDTAEPDVRALLTKVEVGELDAGIVYVTDVASAAGRVDAIAIPADVNVSARDPIVVLDGSTTADMAAAFVAFVLGPHGQRILAAHGFGRP